MKARGKIALGSTGMLALWPAAGILLASLAACSAGDTTTAPSTQIYDDQDHQPLRVDPPPLVDDGETGGSSPPPAQDGGGDGRDSGTPPTIGEQA
jgi:hypothetical protein